MAATRELSHPSRVGRRGSFAALITANGRSPMHCSHLSSWSEGTATGRAASVAALISAAYSGRPNAELRDGKVHGVSVGILRLGVLSPDTAIASKH